MAAPSKVRQLPSRPATPRQVTRPRAVPTQDQRDVQAALAPTIERPPLLHTLESACRELNISDPALRELVNLNLIRVVRIGRAVRISHKELERFCTEATCADHRDR